MSRGDCDGCSPELDLAPSAYMAEADRQLASSESGQRKTEYANLVGFLALALIVGVLFLRDALLDLLGQVVDTFDPQPGA